MWEMLVTILFSVFCLSISSLKTYDYNIQNHDFYGFETWSLTLREEHRLRVFENKVLRRIFGCKQKEVVGGWRKLHNEKLCNLYTSQNIIRVIKSRRMRQGMYHA